MKKRFEFEIVCPSEMSNGIISELEKCVWNLGGEIKHTECGFLNKKIYFFIVVDEKYADNIRRVHKKLQDYYNEEVGVTSNDTNILMVIIAVLGFFVLLKIIGCF